MVSGNQRPSQPLNASGAECQQCAGQGQQSNYTDTEQGNTSKQLACIKLAPSRAHSGCACTQQPCMHSAAVHAHCACTSSRDFTQPQGQASHGFSQLAAHRQQSGADLPAAAIAREWSDVGENKA